MHQRTLLLIIAIVLLIGILIADILWGLGNALTMKYQVEPCMMWNDWEWDKRCSALYSKVKFTEKAVIAIFIADILLMATAVYFLFRNQKEIA